MFGDGIHGGAHGMIQQVENAYDKTKQSANNGQFEEGSTSGLPPDRDCQMSENSERDEDSRIFQPVGDPQQYAVSQESHEVFVALLHPARAKPKGADQYPRADSKNETFSRVLKQGKIGVTNPWNANGERDRDPLGETKNAHPVTEAERTEDQSECSEHPNRTSDAEPHAQKWVGQDIGANRPPTNPFKVIPRYVARIRLNQGIDRGRLAGQMLLQGFQLPRGIGKQGLRSSPGRENYDETGEQG